MPQVEIPLCEVVWFIAIVQHALLILCTVGLYLSKTLAWKKAIQTIQNFEAKISSLSKKLMKPISCKEENGNYFEKKLTTNYLLNRAIWNKIIISLKNITKSLFSRTKEKFKASAEIQNQIKSINRAQSYS